MGKYEDQFKKTNDSVQALLKIQNGHLHWTGVFKKFSNITPSGVYLSEFSTKNYQAFISGKAQSRESLLKFKSALDESDCFSSVNMPLSNLVVKNDVDFQIDLVIKESCLKS